LLKKIRNNTNILCTTISSSGPQKAAATEEYVRQQYIKKGGIVMAAIIPPLGPQLGGRVTQINAAVGRINAAIDKELPASLGSTRQDLRKEIGQINNTLKILEEEIQSKKQVSQGRLFTIGKVRFGWEDIILAVALMIIVVTWLKGDMDAQAALIALFGTGMGGAWGMVSGKASAEAA